MYRDSHLPDLPSRYRKYVRDLPTEINNQIPHGSVRISVPIRTEKSARKCFVRLIEKLCAAICRPLSIKRIQTPAHLISPADIL